MLRASGWTQVIALVVIYGLVMVFFATMRWWPIVGIGVVVGVVLGVGAQRHWWRTEMNNNDMNEGPRGPGDEK